MEAKAWEDASVLACEISECITMKKDESLYRSHDFNDDLTAVDQSFMNSKLKEVEFLLTQTLNYFQEALNYKKKSIQAYREMKIKEAQKLSECSAKTKQNGHLIRESIKLAILQKKLDQSYFCILVDVAINYQKALEYQKRKTTAAQSLIRIYDEILICAVKAIQIFISKNDEENHLQATLANSKCSYAIHFIQLNEQKAIAIAKRKRVSEWNPIVDLYERAIEYNNKAILAIKKNQRGHEYWNNASKYVTNAISAMEKAIEASIINRIQEKNLWMEIARFYQKMVQYAKQIAEKASNDNDDRQFETLRLIECIEKVAKSKEKSAAAFAIGNLEEKNRWSEIGGLYENAQKYQNKALKVLQKSNSEANYWRAASKHANSIALLTERIEELSFTENMEQANYLKQAVNFYQSAIHHSLKAVEEEQQNRRTKLWAYSAEKLVNAAELMEKAAKAIKKGATAILPVYTQSAIFYQTLANFMIETAKKRCEENFFQDPPHVWEIDEYERANWDPSDNIEFVVMEAESSLKGENVQKQQHRPPYWQNVIEYFTTAMDAGYNGNMEAMEKLLDAAMYENNAAIEFFGKSSENEYLVSEDEENLTDMAISGMSIEEERLKHIAVQSYHAAAVASAAMQENEAKNLADAGASAKKAKSCLFFSLYFEEGESNARSSRNYQRAANYYQEALGYFLKASSFFAQGEIKKASFWSDAANYADQAASTLEEMGLCYENKTKYRLKSVFKDHVQILQNHLEKKDIV